MSQEAVQAFVERVNDDATFRDGLIAADDNDARLRIAQEAGFDITAEASRSYAPGTRKSCPKTTSR